MSNLTLGGALEQPCEKHHNVTFITLEGLSSNPGKYNLWAGTHLLGRVSDAAVGPELQCAQPGPESAAPKAPRATPKM